MNMMVQAYQQAQLVIEGDKKDKSPVHQKSIDTCTILIALSLARVKLAAFLRCTFMQPLLIHSITFLSNTIVAEIPTHYKLFTGSYMNQTSHAHTLYKEIKRTVCNWNLWLASIKLMAPAFDRQHYCDSFQHIWLTT